MTQASDDPTERTSLSRRGFLRTAALAASGATLGLRAASSGGAPVSRPIIGFSKPFQSLGPEDTAALVAEVGWDGIECPVRRKGQIEPERVSEELPRFVDAFRRRGLDIPVLVTDITSLRQPYAGNVLAVAARLGIRRIRLGFWKYFPDRPILQQLDAFAGEVKDIGAACGHLGLQAGVENHSGADMIGAPVWDVFTALRDHHAENVGFCFDIGHATIEGGLCWPIQARIAEPYYTVIYVKDFAWRQGANGWRPVWCPLGEGMIERSFFDRLKQSEFQGPICQHHEYPLGDRAEMVGHMRRDLHVLKGWIA